MAVAPEATAQLDASICLILQRAGDFVRKRNRSKIRKEDIVDVITNGIKGGS